MVRFSLLRSIRCPSSALIVGTIALGACSVSDTASSTDAGATTAPAVSSELDDDGRDSTMDAGSIPTTGAAPESTTTTGDSSTTRDAPIEPVLPHGEGSGCVVPGDTLPDGHWFGYAVAADEEGLSFDLACWFIGEDADMVAAQDGEESPVPNDYYVRNQNSRLRSVPVDPSAAIFWLAAPGSPDQTLVYYLFWVANTAARPFQPGVWIEVVNGAVSTLTEQFTP